ncbi:hypothetical protein NDN08_001082 [Rhodosorus marinus]|uniref:C2H2-type domain-containing protein n=1 Tax=Rhodosorus marinus TaxID=101924 RepID=A0AAV8UPS3_9RHOD|nr:hypothetical protein NDN08_001082 [Rhodosorus marinus]
MFREGRRGVYGNGMTVAKRTGGPRRDLKYRCTWEGCEKSFSRHYNFNVHLRLHTGLEPYACPHEGCSKRFKWQSGLTNHIRKHENGLAGQDSEDMKRSAGWYTRALDGKRRLENRDFTSSSDEDGSMFEFEVREIGIQSSGVVLGGDSYGVEYVVKDKVLIRASIEKQEPSVNEA